MAEPGSRKRVAILFSEHDRPERYVISKLAAYWREEGLSVHYLFGTRHYAPADVLLLHVDLSVLPQRILRFAERYPKVINGRVRDIRKSTFSVLAVRRGDGYRGPVIVKTDFNAGGAPEGARHPNPLLRLYYFSRRCAFALLSGGLRYPVYPSPAQVPAPFWIDPFLLVERFVPERRGGDYAVRTYHCFGERDSFFLLASPRPVVRSGPDTRAFPLEPDPRLREIRRAFHLDYGKIDYVLVDGEPVVLDVNKTVGLTAEFASDPVVEHARRDRARAIHEFLA